MEYKIGESVKFFNREGEITELMDDQYYKVKQADGHIFHATYSDIIKTKELIDANNQNK